MGRGRGLNMVTVKFYGTGGQGILTGLKIVAYALCYYDNKYVKAISSYSGAERRGAPVYSDMMIDTKTILLSSFVYNPDIFVIFDPSSISEKIFANENGKKVDLIINCDRSETIGEYCKKGMFENIYYLGATDIAMKYTNSDIPNIPMLGAIAKAGVVRLSSVSKAMRDLTDNGNHKCYQKAIQYSFEKTREI